ncbi:8388_t:CDS:1, partial [Gigaspora rosea]
SSISPIIEAFLKHEVDRYQRNKKSRYNPTIEVEAESYCTAIPVLKPKKSGFEETKSRISDSSPNSLLHRPEGSYSEEE